jgi:hypothetical protein
VILPTLEWTSDMKKNCLGCKKDKPENQFGSVGMDRALCASCRSGRMKATSQRKSRGGKIADAIGDFFEGLGNLLD